MEHALFLLWDDSFYYLEIARNIAAGRGSTFDGLQPTNGYHPLWMSVCVKLFSAGIPDAWAPRAVLVLGLALWGGVLLALLRRAPPVAMAAGVLLGTQAFVLKAIANGMESTVVVVVQAAILLLALRHGETLSRPERRVARLSLSILLACAFLARTDGGLLALSAIAGIGWQARRHGWRTVARVALELGTLPALTLVSFLATNRALFGHAMQVSGELKRVTPHGFGLVAVVIAVAIAATLLLRPPRPGAGPLSTRLWAAPWYPAFLALHVGYYLGFQEYPRQWYFAPDVLWLVYLAPAAVEALATRARADADPGSESRAALLATGPLLVVLGMAWLLGLRSAADPGFLPPRLADIAVAREADRILPADAVIGSWDAGLVGWTSRHPVVNLDGVVASHAYLHALRTGTTAAYLRQLGVTHVLNHHEDDGGLRPTALLDMVASHFGQEAADGAVVLAQEHFTMVASSNDLAHGEHAMATTLLELPR